MIVPTSTKPKPIEPKPAMQSPDLSSPAASPTRLGKLRPITLTGSCGALDLIKEAIPSL